MALGNAGKARPFTGAPFAEAMKVFLNKRHPSSGQYEDVIMKPRFIRIAEVLERTGLGRSTIYKYMAAGTFPPRVSVGGRSVSWLESEIDGWMLAKIEGRDLAWQTRQMSMSTAISPASRAAAHGSH